MRTRQQTNLGCENNKAKVAGKAKYCRENGLDYSIYRLGSDRIKEMILHRHGIELDITGKCLDAITREAQEIEYQ